VKRQRDERSVLRAGAATAGRAAREGVAEGTTEPLGRELRIDIGSSSYRNWIDVDWQAGGLAENGTRGRVPDERDAWPEGIQKKTPRRTRGAMIERRNCPTETAGSSRSLLRTVYATGQFRELKDILL